MDSNSDLLELTDLDLDEDHKERFAHYAESSEVTEGYILGTPVIALCGKIFVPSRDPLKLRICPVCKQIAEALFLSTE
jgi:hypothetical protein